MRKHSIAAKPLDPKHVPKSWAANHNMLDPQPDRSPKTSQKKNLAAAKFPILNQQLQIQIPNV